MRIGQGFDVHAFGPGDSVILGGVSIPHSQGLKAHSDGDVLLHALADALLGAVALGILGTCFRTPATNGPARTVAICCAGSCRGCGKRAMV